MDEGSTRHIAAAWNKALLRMTNRPAPDAAERAWRSIYEALRWLAPDGVEQFAVDESDEPPRLYLLSDEAVFVVAPAPENEQQQLRLSQIHCVPLQPSTATVDLEAMVSSGFGSVRMSLAWTFRLDSEFTLRLQTTAESDSRLEPNHAFASALAKKLNWPLPELTG
jgi:hypothetical protein